MREAPDSAFDRRHVVDGPLSKAFDVDALAGLPVPERIWHVRDMVPARAVTSLSGDGGVGKSLLALQLACATAGGLSWLGQEVRTGPVVYLSAEDDRDELHRRLDRIALFYGTELDRFKGLICAPLADESALLACADHSGALEPTGLWNELDLLLHRMRPRLLVLDSLADVFGGNENDRGQVRQFVGLLRRFAIRHELSVLLLAHPSLQGLSSGSGASGSTAWNNSVRSRLYLSRPKDEAGGASAPHVRTLMVKKSNYGPTGGEIRLRLSGGGFANDDGDVGPGTSRAVAEHRVDKQFLDLLDAFDASGRRVGDSTGRAYAPALFAASPGTQGTTNKGFEAAMHRLFASGAIRVQEEGPPSKRRRFIARADPDGQRVA